MVASSQDASPRQRLIRALVQPPNPHLQPEQQRRAWIVAGMALIGGPFTGLLLLLVVGLMGDFSSWPAFFSIGGFVVTWVLTRTSHDLAATWMLCWSAFLGPAVGLVLNPQQGFDFQFYALFIPPFVASVLLSQWAAVTLVIAAEVMLFLAPHLVPAITQQDVVGAALFGLSVTPVVFVSAVMVSRDLEQMHKQARELGAARDEAVAANQGKSRFLARAGHELRTPLTSVIGYTDLLLDLSQGKDDEALVDDLKRMRRACEHLRTLVEEILTLSRLDLGHLPVKPASVDPTRMGSDCVELVRLQAEANKTKVSLEAEPDLPVVTSDPLKLTQVLLNLLTNAVRATMKGTITLQVKRDPERAGGVLFSVVDTGTGIKEEDLQRVFEEFWQGARPPTGATGAGLGLTITRQLCGLIGATISVKSAWGKGSTFTVHLPPTLP